MSTIRIFASFLLVLTASTALPENVNKKVDDKTRVIDVPVNTVGTKTAEAEPVKEEVKERYQTATGIVKPVQEEGALTIDDIFDEDDNEIGIVIEEESIPIHDEVRGMCDMLGFDPLTLANEGKLVAFVPAERAEKLLATMRSHSCGEDATIIGEVVAEAAGCVGVRTVLGSIRALDMPPGNLVPRIC